MKLIIKLMDKYIEKLAKKIERSPHPQYREKLDVAVGYLNEAKVTFGVQTKETDEYFK